MKNLYVYVIEYDGKISQEGYGAEEKVIQHLEYQGYKKDYGWIYKNEDSIALIKEIKIV